MATQRFLKQNRTGFLYGYIHFVVELVSFYVLGRYLLGEYAVLLTLFYDFYAFVPQILIGYLIDEGIRVPALLLGTIFFACSLLMTALNLPAFPVIFVLAMGSILVHEAGAERTLRESHGRMSPASIFVSSGSFGLISGRLLAMNGVPVLPVLLICLTILIPMVVLKKTENYTEDLSSYRFSSGRFAIVPAIALSVFVVGVRSYMAYGIPTSWNQTILQTVFLFLFMGTGKALGGICIDTIGIRKTILISTLGALPFLLIGDTHMWISLMGILLFSMTMAVSLAILVSLMPNRPGVAFGYTTIGLFLGLCPIFLFGFPGKILNLCLIITLTFVSTAILLMLVPQNTPFNVPHKKEGAFYDTDNSHQ